MTVSRSSACTPSSPVAAFIVPPYIYITELQCTESSESIVMSPSLIISILPALIPFLLSDVSSVVVVVLLLLKPKPPRPISILSICVCVVSAAQLLVFILIVPSLITSIFSACMPSLEALIVILPPSMITFPLVVSVS